MIVACTEPECVGVRVWSQGCGTRLMAVTGTWLRVVADMVDVICVWISVWKSSPVTGKRPEPIRTANNQDRSGLKTGP